jgi:hypothetical protein
VGVTAPPNAEAVSDAFLEERECGKESDERRLVPLGCPRREQSSAALVLAQFQGRGRLARADGSAARTVVASGGGGWLPDGQLVAAGRIYSVSAYGKLTVSGRVPARRRLYLLTRYGQRYMAAAVAVHDNAFPAAYLKLAA